VGVHLLYSEKVAYMAEENKEWMQEAEAGNNSYEKVKEWLIDANEFFNEIAFPSTYETTKKIAVKEALDGKPVPWYQQAAAYTVPLLTDAGTAVFSPTGKAMAATRVASKLSKFPKIKGAIIGGLDAGVALPTMTKASDLVADAVLGNEVDPSKLLDFDVYNAIAGGIGAGFGTVLNEPTANKIIEWGRKKLGMELSPEKAAELAKKITEAKETGAAAGYTNNGLVHVIQSIIRKGAEPAAEKLKLKPEPDGKAYVNEDEVTFEKPVTPKQKPESKAPTHKDSVDKIEKNIKNSPNFFMNERFKQPDTTSKMWDHDERRLVP